MYTGSSDDSRMHIKSACREHGDGYHAQSYSAAAATDLIQGRVEVTIP